MIASENEYEKTEIVSLLLSISTIDINIQDNVRTVINICV